MSVLMALSDLSSSQLSELVKLIEERETLQTKLNKVNQTIARFEDSDPVGPISKPSTVPRRGRKPGTRGTLKDNVLQALKKAGSAGLSVKDLTKKLKANKSSLSVFLYTAPKKFKQIKKISRGVFAYVE